MAFKKLRIEEISQVTAKIRAKYDFYCNTFFKSSRIKTDFEKRYINAIKKGYDISNFLLAEISVIEELIKKEEKRIADSKPVKKTDNKSFADRIIEENMKKIEKYPILNFHKDARDEIKRLAGLLNRIYETRIPSLHSIFRQIEVNPNLRDMELIESQLRALAYTGQVKIPTRLSRYYAYLNQFPRDYRVIEREEKEYILESSFLLHDLHDTLIRIVESTPELKKQDNNNVVEIISYIRQAISDFRLKDLKRKK